MALTSNESWAVSANKLIFTAYSTCTPEEALKILGRKIRQYRTCKNRMERLARQLSRAAITLMERHNIDELQITRRTFLRLVRTFKLPSGAKGQKIYDSLVMFYGQDFIDQLYTIEDQVVLASVNRTFLLNEESLENLKPGARWLLGQNINLNVRLDVVDVPKRVGLGKGRRK